MKEVMEEFEQAGAFLSAATETLKRYGARIAMAGAVLLGASGCEIAPGTIGRPGELVGPEDAELDIRYAGDSLTAQANGDFTSDVPKDRLLSLSAAHGMKADVNALPGGTTRGLIAPTDPNLVSDRTVIALETNDADAVRNTGSGSTEVIPEPGEPKVSVEEYIANIKAYMDAAGSSCYVLVNAVTTNDPRWRLDLFGPIFNARLQTLADEKSGVVLADWNAEVASRFVSVTTEGGNIVTQNEYLNAEDQVHHTPYGKIAYGDFLVNAAVQGCGEDGNYYYEPVESTTTTTTISTESTTTTTIEEAPTTSTMIEEEPATTTTTEQLEPNTALVRLHDGTEFVMTY